MEVTQPLQILSQGFVQWEQTAIGRNPWVSLQTSEATYISAVTRILQEYIESITIVEVGEQPFPEVGHTYELTVFTRLYNRLVSNPLQRTDKLPNRAGTFSTHHRPAFATNTCGRTAKQDVESTTRFQNQSLFEKCKESTLHGI